MMIHPDTTRRGVLVGSVAAAAYAAAPGASAAQPAPAAEPVRLEQIDIALRVNGDVRRATVDIRSTLLDALREQLGLVGTKKGCDRGECGACTVHVGGRRVLACMTLAVRAQDQQITTIEGLAGGEKLHPVQAAFIEHDAFQCGYCTPGQIMSAVACIREGHAGSEAEVAEYMSGNLCRCAAYSQIRAAVLAAAREI
jgi:xanthine dehydrogenase YagT iron-sulfur-binding subunit